MASQKLAFVCHHRFFPTEGTLGHKKIKNKKLKVKNDRDLHSIPFLINYQIYGSIRIRIFGLGFFVLGGNP
jgi:hypothetical protein